MKKFLLASFVFLSAFTSRAGTKWIIGTPGTGITISSMGSYAVGDTLAINTGSYPSSSLSNIHDVTIINYGGVVTFTGTLNLYGSGLYNLFFTGSGSAAFYGFVFSGISGDAINFDQNSGNSTGYGHHFERINFIKTGVCFDVYETKLIYNGTTASLKLRNTTFRNLKCDTTDQLIGGNMNLSGGMMDSITVDHCIINQSVSDGKEITGGFFRANMHDNQFIYYGTQAGSTDVGKFFLAGNGTFYNNFMYGARGYIGRFIIATAGGYGTTPSETYIYNNISIATSIYGGVDIRGDSVDNWPGNAYVSPGNAHVINNTVGNKAAPNNFTTAMLVLYPFAGTVELKNNLAFNNAQVNGYNNSIITNFSSNTISDSGQNFTLSAAQAATLLSDTIHYCVPKSTSSSLATGIYHSYITKDIQGNAITNTTTPIGASALPSACNCVTVPLGVQPVPSGGSRSIKIKKFWFPSGCLPPSITAPASIPVTLPVPSVTVTPTAIGNNGHGIASWKWSKLSGSGTTIDSLHQNLVVTNLASGFSIWQVMATDSCGYSNTSQVIISATAPAPPPVVVNPPNVIAVFSEANARVAVYATDPNNGGSITSYLWTKISGPGLQTIENNTLAEATIKGLQNGTYQFQCAVTNAEGKTTNYVSTLTINIH